MADLKLDEMDRLLAASTPAPWGVLGDTDAFAQRLTLADERQTELADGPSERRRDLLLCAALRNHAPELIAKAREVERLRSALDGLAEGLRKAFYADDEECERLLDRIDEALRQP